MLITVCKSKIHRATVTEANLDYVGSVTIDLTLMKLDNLVEYEKVAVANITNGERFETYTLRGEPDTGEICVNGAAAHLVKPGDLLIIMAYGHITAKEAVDFEPAIVFVDEKNRPTRVAREKAGEIFTSRPVVDSRS